MQTSSDTMNKRTREEIPPVPRHPAPRPPRVRILGAPITASNYTEVIEIMEGWVAERSSRYVCICPVHSVVENWTKAEHREVLNAADLNSADGMPVVWAQRMLGLGHATRVYGPTLMERFLEVAAKKGYRVGLYGGKPECLEQLQPILQKRFPGLQIAYSYSPPFRPLTPEEDQRVVEEINAAQVDVLWVGIGCPRQERWMYEHRDRVQAVMVGVGAAFDFHAGTVRQAPAWMQRSGLEWFFRLCCEPRRLFRRYAVTNSLYILGFASQWLRETFSGAIARRRRSALDNAAHSDH